MDYETRSEFGKVRFLDDELSSVWVTEFEQGLFLEEQKIETSEDVGIALSEILNSGI